jgi:hypothetical protein
MHHPYQRPRYEGDAVQLPPSSLFGYHLVCRRHRELRLSACRCTRHRTFAIYIYGERTTSPLTFPFLSFPARPLAPTRHAASCAGSCRGPHPGPGKGPKPSATAPFPSQHHRRSARGHELRWWCPQPGRQHIVRQHRNTHRKSLLIRSRGTGNSFARVAEASATLACITVGIKVSQSSGSVHSNVIVTGRK